VVETSYPQDVAWAVVVECIKSPFFCQGSCPCIGAIQWYCKWLLGSEHISQSWPHIAFSLAHSWLSSVSLTSVTCGCDPRSEFRKQSLTWDVICIARTSVGSRVVIKIWLACQNKSGWRECDYVQLHGSSSLQLWFSTVSVFVYYVNSDHFALPERKLNVKICNTKWPICVLASHGTVKISLWNQF
jgi:hypothetical protein